ncbi:MAG TPA: amidohydrolase family protein [Kineosporiaceae bacterium]
MRRPARDLVVRNASVEGAGPTEVLVRGGVVVGVGEHVAAASLAGARVVDAGGAAVLPGLHDHHCHLLAMAAAARSVPCGPPDTNTLEQLAAALRTARPIDGWIRGIGYHESVAGDLDRDLLDRLRPEVPVRIQHGGGSLWVMNSAALRWIGLDEVGAGEPRGVERDADGRATGRLWRSDGWLRGQLGTPRPPDLAGVSAELASYGITGVTDATPDLDPDTIALLRSGGIRQRLTLLGDPGSSAPHKVVVSDHALPSLDELADAIQRVRPRAVAVHCVTRVALVLTAAALGVVGSVRGDRVEHVAVGPPEVLRLLAALQVTVVTQPSMPVLRGDRYLADVEADDREHLWPFASLLAAGIPVGCSSDAPYGHANPWFTIRAAATRTTAAGRGVAVAERVAAAEALRGFLTPALSPGGPVRRIEVGAPADLVVLDAPLAEVLRDLDRGHVRMTLVDGEVVHGG